MKLYLHGTMHTHHPFNMWIQFVGINVLSCIVWFQASGDNIEFEMLPSTADSSIYAANEVAARLRVDTRTGLTWSEAKYRAKIIGHNELNASEEEPPWKKYVEQFQNPLILLLLGKSV